MIEAYLRDSGAGWTNLHPNMFMQNLLAGWRVKGVERSRFAEPVSG
jgi:NAD(P)H dehydrogenase (quinone)